MLGPAFSLVSNTHSSSFPLLPSPTLLPHIILLLPTHLPPYLPTYLPPYLSTFSSTQAPSPPFISTHFHFSSFSFLPYFPSPPPHLVVQLSAVGKDNFVPGLVCNLIRFKSETSKFVRFRKENQKGNSADI